MALINEYQLANDEDLAPMVRGGAYKSSAEKLRMARETSTNAAAQTTATTTKTKVHAFEASKDSTFTFESEKPSDKYTPTGAHASHLLKDSLNAFPAESMNVSAADYAILASGLVCNS